MAQIADVILMGKHRGTHPMLQNPEMLVLEGTLLLAMRKEGGLVLTSEAWAVYQPVIDAPDYRLKYVMYDPVGVFTPQQIGQYQCNEVLTVYDEPLADADFKPFIEAIAAMHLPGKEVWNAERKIDASAFIIRWFPGAADKAAREIAPDDPKLRELLHRLYGYFEEVIDLQLQG